jgi:hypothetical protein
MDRGEVPHDGRSDLLGARHYFKLVQQNLGNLGSQPIAPGFIQRLQGPRDREEFLRWPQRFVRQELIRAEFDGKVKEVLNCLDNLVAWTFRSGPLDRALDMAIAHQRRAQQDGDAAQRFAADANVAAARHRLGDRAAADIWYAVELADPRASDARVRNGLLHRLPHALWGSKDPLAVNPPRDFALVMFDALSMNWTKPPTGHGLERAARSAFDDGNFVIGRLLAHEAIATYREEGDTEGTNRCLALLESAAEQDNRSWLDPYGICEELHAVWSAERE